MSVLSEAQRTCASLQFLLLDQDSDGFIGSHELGTYLRAIGLYPAQSDIASYIALVDPEEQGRVSQESALALYEKLYPQRTTPEELYAALKVLDDDADGYLTTTQLRHILVNLGARISQEDAEEILRDVEKDREGMIMVDDIIQLLMPTEGEECL
ncbi:calmodulin-like protein [Leishmania mexicana MHOM/GT/2001/U1103]|uniref:Calmodulin-like protein n=1 Tax=Leishmania mexicana (strain MHOM/GT/2001/U1103) TaxID=929439 RepID=E9AUY9_LEIMU|nr:calmodulin-like protein [Leishmania mexicana MHOM/GT/2001/U1103]CBZ26770.1 calmodulin-like protein [Leishmania mexicana MHOM/GT/2001/U1103]